MKISWKNLYFGVIHKDEVLLYTPDPTWQRLRRKLKNKPLEERKQMLYDHLQAYFCNRAAQVQVTNYVTALSRGGLIKPWEYREVTDKELWSMARNIAEKTRRQHPNDLRGEEYIFKRLKEERDEER